MIKAYGISMTERFPEDVAWMWSIKRHCSKFCRKNLYQILFFNKIARLLITTKVDFTDFLYIDDDVCKIQVQAKFFNLLKRKVF